MPRKPELHHILDSDQRITRWPSRKVLREMALAYLASKFLDEQDYTEAAVNAALRRWCAFDDPALLRRELFERGFPGRSRDGRRYWKRERIACSV